MSTSGVYGPLVGTWDVERAVIATLGTWIDSYLHEVEAQHGIKTRRLDRPSAVDGIYGGVDFESFEEDLLPALIVTIVPGTVENFASAGYGAWYEAQVGCVFVGRDEDDAREVASYYATAVAGVLTQQGDLDGFAERTVLTQQPHVVFPDPEGRRLAQGICAVNIFVQPIVNELLGPSAPDPQTNPPDHGNLPQVEHVDITVRGTPLD